MRSISNSENTSSSLETCHGSIERIVFHNRENGFFVIRIKAVGHRDLVTVVGSSANITAGEYIHCKGNWVNNAEYGLQFRAQHVHLAAPNTKEGIEKYLGSGLIKGIGPHFAKKLVDAFGEQVFEVFENEPKRLSELSGIGKWRTEKILQAWSEQKVIRDIMIFLQSHGIGTARAVRIYKTYGDKSIQKITDDPYCLAIDIVGIGFKTADALAKKLGIPEDALIRVQAALRHLMQESASQGNCAVVRENIIKETSELLSVDAELVEQAIAIECTEKRIVEDNIENKVCYFLAGFYQAEINVCKNIKRLLNGPPTHWQNLEVDKAIPWVEEKTGLQLSLSQRNAVATAIKNKVVIITGGPGVGKTTVINSILKILQQKRVRTLLCAPTGRAAKRLSESTGREAKTIHRVLGKNKTEISNAELIVADETSMIDILLLNQLLQLIPDRTALLLVGDVDQLPSVGPGAVLSDLIDSRQIEVVRLTEIFRQASTSHIIINAHRVNQGKMPYFSDKQDKDSAQPKVLTDFYFIDAAEPEDIQQKLIQVITQRIPQRFGLDPMRDIQVLAPMNRNSLGARALNVLLQENLNKDAQPQLARFGWTFMPGDKVIQTVNNYDKEVFNGDVGFITHIDLEEGEVKINFDGRIVVYDVNDLDEVSLAYAITIHKSQGSEYPAVVIPMATQHYMLLERNLLYTAITRGKKLVVMIGQKKAVAMAVHRLRAQQRLTKLAKRLEDFISYST